MTTLNGQRQTVNTTRPNDCLVVSVRESRKPEMRQLGYLYAMYKLPGQHQATRGFGFKKNCILDIDNGFAFDEKAILVYNEALRSSVVCEHPDAGFYPPLPQVSPEFADELQEQGIHPDPDRVQDLPATSRASTPQAVVPNTGMTVAQLMEFMTPEDQDDLKRQLAYTIAAAKCLGVSQYAMWQQATSLAGVHFIPAFDPRYKESLR